MCGRYWLAEDSGIDEIDAILAQAGQHGGASGNGFKTGEIFPSNRVPIVKRDERGVVVTTMNWGFARWDNKGLIINARGETASSNRMFGEPLRQRRCVVPSTGFFEWSHAGGKPQEKYLFHVEGDESGPLYMAGLWSVQKLKDGTAAECFVIMTRAANATMAEVHNRMPVIMYKREIACWLADYEFAAGIIGRGDVLLSRKAAA